ncbi:acyl-CoA dehydrogenase family protein [Arthrobacter sp. AL08]|uniref:Rv1679 family acyl-CoA dehydrogenase n=1 Tax=Micrococcaceae TaxID=1268 RepID=UPI001CFFF6FF|nr:MULTISPECIES: acyl-CoA dehydrogenase family protein [Micrococcaceae]MDI3243411.1 acyl-CoA dehydrogenase family protein [Arthrobacter sp. AL05]MDI3279420.1 acyl-CoA dehydrogenase family protein [Arthrobacter sp. AL08]MDJ0354329.1 acyl-CoA dehydrogenase family protein [Pseudarthrobacter sp. PH31-O2]WGZ80749.1 acyl-CoA dehydrogenase family protein [Arthrobacter sp. EM1]
MSTSQALDDVVKVAREHAERVDTDGVYPLEAVAELRAGGLLGLVLPVEVGGAGAGPEVFTETVSALAEACGSTAMIYLMHAAAAVTIAAAPPPDLPDLLAGMARGTTLGTLAFSERGSRSHFWAPVSIATASGSTVVLRADKSWVTSAAHADVYVVSTGTPSGVPGEVDLYALPAGTQGVDVAGPWRGLGLRGNDSAPMTINAGIPVGYRLGGPATGFARMMETVLPWFNLGNAAVSLGLASAATRAAVEHVGVSRLEHLGHSLAGLPTIRAQIARMAISLAVQRAYLAQAAGTVASPGEDTLLHVLGVKASANDAALEITDAAMRVCGGAAFSKHLPIERAFRDARAGSVMAPTADALYDFYGRALTGLPLFSGG